MRSIAVVVIIVVTLLSIATNRAFAANVSCVSPVDPSWGACEIAYIEGRIDPGDFELVRRLMAESRGKLTQFRLNSPGGNVVEAIKIGRLFREQLVSAWAPTSDNGVPSLPADFTGPTYNTRVCHGPACICYSACALIWLGAIERTGTVGLHRPSTDAADFRALPPQEASMIYRQWLAAKVAYMKDMEAPQPVIDAMIQTSSAEIIHVSSTQLGLEHPPSIIEWLNASCGARTAAMDARFNQLWDTDARSRMPIAEREQANEFVMQYASIGTCRRKLLENHRKPMQ
jgi:hypothetical protein